MSSAAQLPGFRRRFRITPSAAQVLTEVEDDYHCMSVLVKHDGVVAKEIIPMMHRAPWTTCPGAVEQLILAFSGVALSDFPAQSGKMENCTHLYDLALLAGKHAFDRAESVYDILVADPVDGKRVAEIYKNGECLISWVESGFKIVESALLEGARLDTLRPGIENLKPAQLEAARLLRWGNMIAHGRSIPMEQQSDASRMPPNCFTFQPQRAAIAKRIGAVYDFSNGTRQPLERSESI